MLPLFELSASEWLTDGLADCWIAGTASLFACWYCQSKQSTQWNGALGTESRKRRWKAPHLCNWQPGGNKSQRRSGAAKSGQLISQLMALPADGCSAAATWRRCSDVSLQLICRPLSAPSSRYILCPLSRRLFRQHHPARDVVQRMAKGFRREGRVFNGEVVYVHRNPATNAAHRRKLISETVSWQRNHLPHLPSKCQRGAPPKGIKTEVTFLSPITPGSIVMTLSPGIFFSAFFFCLFIQVLPAKICDGTESTLANRRMHSI